MDSARPEGIEPVGVAIRKKEAARCRAASDEVFWGYDSGAEIRRRRLRRRHLRRHHLRGHGHDDGGSGGGGCCHD